MRLRLGFFGIGEKVHELVVKADGLYAPASAGKSDTGSRARASSVLPSGRIAAILEGQ
jgi:hypothetical protein